MFASRSQGEAGFSLVELMVALVIGAGVAIALGGMLSFGSTLRQRSEEAASILGAISRLESLRNAIVASAGLARDVSFLEIGPDGFVLTAEDRRAPFPMQIATTQSAAGGGFGVKLAYDESNQVTSVDLSMFDDVKIEFLRSTGSAMEWFPGGELGTSDVLATRIRVAESDREWNVPLWIVPRALP